MANIAVKTSEPSVCELTETEARIFTSHLTQYYGTLALIFITAQHFCLWNRLKPRNTNEYTDWGGGERTRRKKNMQSEFCAKVRVGFQFI